MFSVGEKIIYGENGVCTVDKIAPLDIQDAPADKLYYHLSPLVGSGNYFAPVETAMFMRSVMTREEALAFIATIPSIEPAICNDNRFNHVDAFYKDLFKLHTCEAIVALIKGLNLRIAERKTKSTRAESTLKRAKDILLGELSVSLGIPINQVEQFIFDRVGETGLQSKTAT